MLSLAGLAFAQQTEPLVIARRQAWGWDDACAIVVIYEDGTLLTSTQTHV